MTQTAETRRFRVHARHLDAHDARLLEERSFEAAAVAYVEDLDALGDQDEIIVIVRDVDSSQEHSFRLDVESGDTVRCG